MATSAILTTKTEVKRWNRNMVRFLHTTIYKLLGFIFDFFFLCVWQVEVSSSLQAEWESFEKMISGDNGDTEKPESVQEFLQAGIVAYPGLFQNIVENEKEESKEDDKNSPGSSEEEGKRPIM